MYLSFLESLFEYFKSGICLDYLFVICSPNIFYLLCIFLKINYGINGVDGLLFFTAKILPAKQDLHQL